MNKKIITLSGLLYLHQFILPISYPITPTEPTVLDMDKKDTSKNKSSKQTSIEKKIFFEVIITLGSGDTIQGKASFTEKISFTHYRNGLLYKQTLLLKDVKEISILEYKSTILKKNKSQISYEFFPSKVNIKTKENKTSYIVSSLFKQMLKFNIKTIYGTTNLFAFFSDTFDYQKGWEEVNSKDIKYHLKKPHPQSIIKILINGKIHP